MCRLMEILHSARNWMQSLPNYKLGNCEEKVVCFEQPLSLEFHWVGRLWTSVACLIHLQPFTKTKWYETLTFARWLLNENICWSSNYAAKIGLLKQDYRLNMLAKRYLPTLIWLKQFQQKWSFVIIHRWKVILCKLYLAVLSDIFRII